MAFREIGVAAVLWLLLAAPAQAAKMPVIFGWGGEHVVATVELPQEPRFVVQGTHVDIGVIYKQVTIFFLPIWTYDFRRILSVAGTSTYFTVEPAVIDAVAASVGATAPERPDLGFWTEWGGKLVLAATLLGIVAYIWGGGRRAKAGS